MRPGRCPQCGWLLEVDQLESTRIQCSRCRSMLCRDGEKLELSKVRCPSCGATISAEASCCPQCQVALSMDD